MRSIQKISASIRQWGSSASIKLLESSTEVFQVPGIDGYMGYLRQGKCLAVFGDPVASPADQKALTLAFHAWAKEQKKEIVYITISQEFGEWISQDLCKTVLAIGEELILNPHQDLTAGSEGRVIRRKMRYAQREGVVVSEWTPEGSESREHTPYEAIQEVIKAWQSARQGVQLYYASIEVFESMEKKRYFYAKYQEKMVGVAMLYYLERMSRWVLHMLLVTEKAPTGTPEILVASIGEALKKEGSSGVSLGIVQKEKIEAILGLGGLKHWVASMIFTVAQKMFSLDGRRLFWKKFRPHSEQTLIACTRSKIGLPELLAMKSTFNIKAKKRPLSSEKRS